MNYTEVHAGRFFCEHCGASWIGSWHGPKEDITCVKCEKKLEDSEINETNEEASQ